MSTQMYITTHDQQLLSNTTDLFQLKTQKLPFTTQNHSYHGQHNTIGTCMLSFQRAQLHDTKLDRERVILHRVTYEYMCVHTYSSWHLLLTPLMMKLIILWTCINKIGLFSLSQNGDTHIPRYWCTPTHTHLQQMKKIHACIHYNEMCKDR